MVELKWTGRTPSAVDRVWSVLSNTDAFNRRAGLGFKFEAKNGYVRGQATVAGVTSTWTETPFRWVAPHWFESTRMYDSGPVSQTHTRCELSEGPEGTDWTYRVLMQPRSFLMGPVVSGLANFIVRPKLARALASVEKVLAGDDADWDPPPVLDADATKRFDNALRWVPTKVADALRKRVLHAPLSVQACLRPLEVAREEGLSDDDAIEGFMLAVKGHALRLSWRVICPRCRTTSIEIAPLPTVTTASHCDTCGISFDGSLADNVEAIFSVEPSIRPGPVPVDCILSPRWTPHVIAQITVAPRGQVALPVTLAVGCYRVEFRELGAVWLEVSHDAEDSEVVVVAGRVAHPRLARVKPGQVQLRLVNQGQRAVDVSLVRRWRPPFVLSAAHLLSAPSAQVLIPEVLLAPAMQVKAKTGWAVVATGPSEALDLLTPELPPDALVDRARPKLLVAMLSTPQGALAAAEGLVRGGGPVGLGLARGVVVVLGDQTLGGPAVDTAIALLERVGRPRVILARDDLAALRPGLDGIGDRVVLAERGAHVLLAFGSMLEPPTSVAVAEAAEPELSDDLGIPEVVGPYRVLRELDRGGMGQVLEAMDPEGQRVAVKLILPAFKGSESLQQRFFNESWYASKVRHPNVVEVREFGLHDERPWLAMEFLIGSTLHKELTRSKRLAPHLAADLLDGVLGGLSALHDVGLVHRDLKPANVMVLRDVSAAPGGVKLMDFGLVRRAGRHPDEGLMGTPDYMAPEQLVGDDIGPYTDVYSAGVMAYRMVVGRLPFRGDRQARVMDRVARPVGDLPDLHLLGELEAVVRAALQPVQSRPATAGALRELLLASRNGR